MQYEREDGTVTLEYVRELEAAMTSLAAVRSRRRLRRRHSAEELAVGQELEEEIVAIELEGSFVEGESQLALGETETRLAVGGAQYLSRRGILAAWHRKFHNDAPSYGRILGSIQELAEVELTPTVSARQRRARSIDTTTPRGENNEL